MLILDLTQLHFQKYQPCFFSGRKRVIRMGMNSMNTSRLTGEINRSICWPCRLSVKHFVTVTEAAVWVPPLLYSFPWSNSHSTSFAHIKQTNWLAARPLATLYSRNILLLVTQQQVGAGSKSGRKVAETIASWFVRAMICECIYQSMILLAARSPKPSQKPRAYRGLYRLFWRAQLTRCSGATTNKLMASVLAHRWRKSS